MSGVGGSKQLEKDDRVEVVKAAFKAYPDFPKPGILFQDIFGVFSDVKAQQALISLATDFALSRIGDIDVVIGLESRGFLLGPIMANAAKKPFVPARKKGKLPGKCISVGYELEYGNDQLEVQQESLNKGDRVLIVDDLLATGGTMHAAVELVKKCGAEVACCWVVVELTDLQGRCKINSEIESLLHF